ncbi:MAG: phenylalanine--tRNA ligase subunit alpha [Acidimicrobiia bacterium]|nr:phenylalanine--tRNA ligase subunit alpha [Acidimicrobiia bacterium]
MDNSPELDALLARLDTGASRDRISAAADVAELEVVERDLLGRRSGAREVREAIKGLDPSERPVAGRALSSYEAGVREMLAERATALAAAAAAAGEADAAERLDLTLGGHGLNRGHHHLVTQVQRELEDIFVAMGYAVAEGPEVEDDWHNFEALNFPPGHPARAMQDTLYVKLGRPEQVMLRTHTSPVQIRVMQSQPPPIYCVMPGRTYRNETLDARHSPVFHQIEGLAVDRGITFGDLAGTIEAFTSAYFRTTVPTRLLPSFFPFTEPSAEFAVGCVFCEGSGCRVCSQTGWIELGGCGMVDPNVFAAVGIDPEEYSGFAFGFGLERMPMLRYGVNPIKTFFDGDIRFLSQY